jgi:hypothetical protein
MPATTPASLYTERPRPALGEPLLVTVYEAKQLLNVSNTCFYEQVLPELETFKVGTTRRITLASVKAYVAKRLAEGAGRRGRGRSRKPQPLAPEIGA